MHIAGSHHGLTQFLSQTDDGAVKLPQFLFLFHNALFQHKGIVADGLDLQKIIERGDSFQFVLALAIHHRLEQLTRFTGRTNNQTLPQTENFRFGHTGLTLKIFQVGKGDQLIEIPQAQLIFRKQDNMAGVAIGDSILTAHPLHGGIDALQMGDAHFRQFFQVLCHNQTAGDRIIRRPMVIKLRQAQGICHHIQLKPAQMGHQILGQHQGICRGKFIGITQALTGGADKSCVKIRIVGNQHMIPHKFQELGENFLQFRCATEHTVGNARQLHRFLL